MIARLVTPERAAEILHGLSALELRAILDKALPTLSAEQFAAARDAVLAELNRRYPPAG